MKRLTILLLTVVLFSACSWDGKFKRVKVANEYSLDVPTFLDETKMLNEIASLQYQNMFREFYVIVIDEKKYEVDRVLNQDKLLRKMYSNDLEGYTEMMLLSYSMTVKMDNEPQILDGKVGNLPARFVTLEGTSEGEEVFGKVAFIEGLSKYYQVYTFTVASKKEEHKIKMNQVLMSFEEI